jgi:hypothetical protein
MKLNGSWKFFDFAGSLRFLVGKMYKKFGVGQGFWKKAIAIYRLDKRVSCLSGK